MATLYPTLSVVDSNGQPVTGEASKLTLKVVTDGVAAAYTGTVTEAADGEYKVAVAEAGTLQTVCGDSSTSGSIVVPARWRNQAALTAQQTRDAMKLAASAGAAAAGSIDAKLDTAQALAWSVSGLAIVNGELEVIAPRGDTYALRIEVTDDDGVAIDLSGYTTFAFTVKAAEYRGDATDVNKLFQAAGTLGGVGNNVLTFALTTANTEAGDCDAWYDCDIEVSTALRTAVYTPLRGRYKSTFDVTRGA